MAATFFGEVVEVPSRAGLEEEEEEEGEEEPATNSSWQEEAAEDVEIRRGLHTKREVEVFWDLKPATVSEGPDLKQFPCSQFILAVGQSPVAFLSSFVLNSETWKVAGSVKLWNEWCKTTNSTNPSPTDSFCKLYCLKSDPTVFLCQCNCYVAEDQQYQWLEKVLGSLQKKDLQVTILTTRHVTDYKTPESTLNLPSPFLKALKTKTFNGPVCCPLLEQPNIVHGLPAAVLSYCQVWQIPAVLYQCYSDVMKLDPVTVEAFKPVLSSRSLKSLAENISKSTEMLKKLMTTNEIQNNIYT
ncbi:proteasome assembly chaperone 1 [Ornithorhynchus anatinus]|uniref:Proteasome assembly chaperone 1 n=1 Tax=Ornithorhynchus anatinus TaxID=9258 RepID=F6WHV6_ORNAN|nr:proteasome assembly chaperone 1 [Ornithorhynchus anatinus]